MPKQSLDFIDYFGALAAAIVFFSTMFIISVTCILYCCVTKHDDPTVFAKWGIGPRQKINNRANEYHLMTTTTTSTKPT